MPRDTFTRRPPPGRPPAGAALASAILEDRVRLAALGADAGDQERQAGHDRPDRRRARPGRCAPTTRPTVPPGPQVAARRATRTVERLGREARVGVRGDHEVLELPRPGVRGAAEDVGEAVGSIDERRDRLGAEVRVDRDRVGAETVEQGDRLARGGRPDVAALRVGEDGQVRRETRADPLEGGHPGRPERLEEREVRLDRGGVRGGRLDDAASRTARRPRGRARTRRAAWPDPGRDRGTGPSRSRPIARPVARGRCRSLGRRARAAGRARGRDRGRRRRRGRQLARRDEPVGPRRAVEAGDLGQGAWSRRPSSRARSRRGRPSAGRRSAPRCGGTRSRRPWATRPAPTTRRRW